MHFRRSRLDRLTAWAPVLILAALAALTYWLDAQVQKQPPTRNGGDRHEPDIFITNFSAANLGPDGTVRDRVTAARGFHYPDDRSTELERPTLIATETAKPRLEVSADRAVISGDREDVFFYGNVRAMREASEKSKDEPVRGPFTLTTDFLHVQPRTQRLSTDRPVTITEPRAIIRGAGLEYDNESKTLSITGPSGEFQPQKK